LDWQCPVPHTANTKGGEREVGEVGEAAVTTAGGAAMRNSRKGNTRMMMRIATKMKNRKLKMRTADTKVRDQRADNGERGVRHANSFCIVQRPQVQTG